MTEANDRIDDLLDAIVPDNTTAAIIVALEGFSWKPAGQKTLYWRDMTVTHLRNCAALVDRQPDKFRDQGFSSPERLARCLRLYADYRERNGQ